MTVIPLEELDPDDLDRVAVGGHACPVHVGGVHRRPRRRRGVGAPQQRAQVPSLHPRRDRRAGETQQGGQEIRVQAQGIEGPPGLEAGPGQQQRHPQAVLVQVLLAHQPVLPEGEAVIGGVDHERVLGEAEGLEGLEDAPDPVVEVTDHPVVVGEVAAHLLVLPGQGGQGLVALAERGGVHGVGAVVLRQRHRGGIGAGASAAPVPVVPTRARGRRDRDAMGSRRRGQGACRPAASSVKPP